MIRTIVVVALSMLVIGLTLPNIWLPLGDTFPLRLNVHFDVVSIVPGPQIAGIRVGDHVDPSSTTVFSRAAAISNYYVRPGEVLSLTVRDAVSGRPTTIREAYSSTQASGLTALKRVTASLFIVVAATLLLMRPSPMLWGFFLFALGSANGSTLILEWASPTVFLLAWLVVSGLTYNVIGPLGLLIFATRFPAPSERGWRSRVSRALPIIALVLVASSVPEMLYMAGVMLPPQLEIFNSVPVIAATTLGVVTLFAGFAEIDASQRQKLRWVGAGVVLFYAAIVYQEVSPYLPSQGWPATWTSAGWTADVLNALVLLIPITVAYAVFKHHVLDLNFVIGRGLVYAIITSIAVATFAVIEWLVGGVLAQTRLAAAGEVVAAIAIGFWLNAIHARVDGFVDAFIFRKRHLAEQRLANVASGLPHADNADTVSAMVLQEPLDAFELKSAALFTRSPDGKFCCTASVGMGLVAGASVESVDRLAVHLQGARGAVHLARIGWVMPGQYPAERSPTLACPIFVRHHLRAIALYGNHRTGEAFDPDEVRILEAICVGASAAIDHIEAADLERRLGEAEEKVSSLSLALDSLRGPASANT